MPAELTADGAEIKTGDRLLNYYDLKWGVVEGEIGNDGWFTLRHDDGTATSLNGQRVVKEIPHWLRNHKF